MINLQFGVNLVCLTLSENTTIENPTYLFEFVNDLTKEKVVFIAQDSSLYKQRYNQFNITLVGNGGQSLLSGQIYLKDTGFYSYNVYQQVSTSNLNPLLSDGLVETGKVIYEFTQSDSIELESSNEFIVYGQ